MLYLKNKTSDRVSFTKYYESFMNDAITLTTALKDIQIRVGVPMGKFFVLY